MLKEFATQAPGSRQPNEPCQETPNGGLGASACPSLKVARVTGPSLESQSIFIELRLEIILVPSRDWMCSLGLALSIMRNIKGDSRYTVAQAVKIVR